MKIDTGLAADARIAEDGELRLQPEQSKCIRNRNLSTGDRLAQLFLPFLLSTYLAVEIHGGSKLIVQFNLCIKG